jgi:hypothetical protein
MSKITLTRFPDPPDNYDPRSFAELIRMLEQLILQLNSTYVQDTQNISEAEAWYFSR